MKVPNKRHEALDTLYRANQVRGDTSMHTPRILVEKMLDEFPMSLWSNPNATFLDPACGRGTFLIAIYERLFDSLSSVIPDTEKRKKHILKNQLWGVDVNPMMIRLANAMFTLYIKDTTNLICANSLEYDIGMKFDVVIGNPPFQASVSGSRSTNLWSRFVQRGIELVLPEGFLSLITPSAITSPSSDINGTFGILKSNNLLWVDSETISSYFREGSTFTAFLLQKCSYKFRTQLADATFIDIRELPYLPKTAIATHLHKKILSTKAPRFLFSTKGSITQLGEVSKTKKKGYFPCYHTKAQPCIWSSLKKDELDKEKVVFSISGELEAFYDPGTLQTTHNSHYSLVSSAFEGQNMANLLNSKLYQFLMRTAKWNGFVNTTMLRNLPMLDCTHSWTNEQIYEHFNLTPEEIAYIEATVK
jgi:SAM-dependent methyltransferase